MIELLMKLHGPRPVMIQYEGLRAFPPEKGMWDVISLRSSPRRIIERVLEADGDTGVHASNDSKQSFE